MGFLLSLEFLREKEDARFWVFLQFIIRSDFFGRRNSRKNGNLLLMQPVHRGYAPRFV
jgi:hypothetical protein